MSTVKSKFIKKYVENAFISDDSPSDSNAYLRHNNNWKFIETPISSISDAPSDNKLYDRKDNNWIIQDPRSYLNISPVIGIELVSPGNYVGVWRNIDASGNPVKFVNNVQRQAYFDNHPVFGGIKEETIDGQNMVRIPKFYYKNENHDKIWISPYKVNDSFKCHPAFLRNGEEMDCFWIGKYHASVSSSKLCSVPNVLPASSTSFNQFRTYAANRNVGGITGFNMMSIYSLGALQQLIIIEGETTDAPSVFGPGVKGKTSKQNVSSAESLTANYRGIIGFWNNVYDFIDGIRCNNRILEVFDITGDMNTQYASSGITIPVYTTQQNLVNYGYMKKPLVKTDDQTYDFKAMFVPDMSNLTMSADETSYTSSGTALFCSASSGVSVFTSTCPYTNAGLFHWWSSGLLPTNATFASIGCRMQKI